MKSNRKFKWPQFLQIRKKSFTAGDQNNFNRHSTITERDGNLREHWYIACLSRELSVNQTLKRIIYDIPLVLFRDERGTPRSFEDRCIHRAAELSKGCVVNGKLQCPYHGWTYQGDGHVCKVPSDHHFKSNDSLKKTRPVLSAKTHHCVEQDGCVWVYMGDQESQLSQTPPPFRFPFQDDSSWKFYFMITDFDNEVTHLAENYMDVPHTVFVHSKWFRNESKKEVPIQVDIGHRKLLVTYHQPNDSIGFTTRLVNPKLEPMTHTDCFILPNITKVDYRFGSLNGFTIISQITPVSELKSRVYTFIGYRVGPRWMNWILKPFFSFYTRQVIEQDVDIMAIQKENLMRNLNPPFMQTDADVVHLGIEKLRDLERLGSAEANTYSKKIEKIIWI